MPEILKPFDATAAALEHGRMNDMHEPHLPAFYRLAELYRQVYLALQDERERNKQCTHS